jgi:hypothetical protein
MQALSVDGFILHWIFVLIDIRKRCPCRTVFTIFKAPHPGILRRHRKVKDQETVSFVCVSSLNKIQAFITGLQSDGSTLKSSLMNPAWST